MKVAVSTQDPGMNSLVDSFFGRAQYFVVVNTESDEFTVYNNGVRAKAVHAAGIRAAGAAIHLGCGDRYQHRSEGIRYASRRLCQGL